MITVTLFFPLAFAYTRPKQTIKRTLDVEQVPRVGDYIPVAEEYCDPVPVKEVSWSADLKSVHIDMMATHVSGPEAYERMADFGHFDANDMSSIVGASR